MIQLCQQNLKADFKKISEQAVYWDRWYAPKNPLQSVKTVWPVLPSCYGTLYALLTSKIVIRTSYFNLGARPLLNTVLYLSSPLTALGVTRYE